MDSEKIIAIARETLDRGLNHSRTTKITRATDEELLDFARAIYTAQVEDACARIDVHVRAAGQIATIRAAMRNGLTDAALGLAVRKLLPLTSTSSGAKRPLD